MKRKWGASSNNFTMYGVQQRSVSFLVQPWQCSSVLTCKIARRFVVVSFTQLPHESLFCLLVVDLMLRQLSFGLFANHHMQFVPDLACIRTCARLVYLIEWSPQCIQCKYVNFLLMLDTCCFSFQNGGGWRKLGRQGGEREC